MADTIFVGLSENPLRLRYGAKPVYDLFDGKFKKLIQIEILRAEGRPEKKY